MAMAKKTIENGKIVAVNGPGKHPANNKCVNKKGAPSPVSAATPTRQSPTHSNTSGGANPRTSPGLLAGHYAGCKFSEPPLPSALPLPPQHWMQVQQTVARMQPYHLLAKSDKMDIAQQLKVLLKVQA